MAQDTDIAIELSPHAWMQVQYAIDQRVAELYRHRAEAMQTNWGEARFVIETIESALGPLALASSLIGDALYPEAPDGIDLAKREWDVLEAVSRG